MNRFQLKKKLSGENEEEDDDEGSRKVRDFLLK